MLSRTHSDQFLVSFKDVGRKPPTFGDASVIALELLNSGYEFDEGSIIFNQFKSVISYKTEEKPIFSFSTVVAAGKPPSHGRCGDWDAVSVVQSACCFYKGRGVGSQPSHISSQLSVIAHLTPF